MIYTCSRYDDDDDVKSQNILNMFGSITRKSIFLDPNLTHRSVIDTTTSIFSFPFQQSYL